MKQLTKSICWEMVSITKDRVNQVGIAIFQKPASNECYEKRPQNEPPVCQVSDDPNASWYIFCCCKYFSGLLLIEVSKKLNLLLVED